MELAKPTRKSNPPGARQWRASGWSIFSIAPVLVIAILLGPVLIGLWQLGLTALGRGVPGSDAPLSLSAFTAVLQEPGIGTSIWLSLWLGPVTTLISLLIAVLFVAAASGTRAFAVVLAFIKPVLAVPHAAAAFGLALLIMPSGYLVRLFSPWLTGFDRPPDWLVVNDPAGFALLVGLVLKEIPFLLLVLVAALPQVDQRRIKVARSFGYGRLWAFLTTTFPLVYTQIRLPIFAVIAFASSVVDVALILGPGTPPPLAVRILRWMNDPQISMQALAAAAAVLQCGITLIALFIWAFGERVIARFGRRLTRSGHRFPHDRAVGAFGLIGAGAVAGVVLVSIAVLALASVSGVWRFPETLPRSFDGHLWLKEWPNLLETSMRATLIASVAAIFALAVVIICLENEYRLQTRLSVKAQFLLYLPLLVPQIAFLPGLLLFLLIAFGVSGPLWAVVFTHLVFVLPYVYLTLADPWHAFDTRYLDVARGLGHSRLGALMRIRMPMLLRPILTAFALGFAVSIAQYLPTLLIGAGRQPTITTEAVALASGGNRNLIGVYGLAQTALPFLVFAMAALVPSIIWRNRRALQPGYDK